jgi:hypothetical protein
LDRKRAKMKFKAGDKVIYVKHCDEPNYIEDDMDTFTIGKEYVIERIRNDALGCSWYDFEGIGRGVWEDQVEGRIKNTKLARKMYPEHKVIDENWIYKGVKND